jgi:hypothetical protein
MAERLQEALTDASETVISTIVILAGLTEPWDRLGYAERCALSEAELRALDDRLRTVLGG